MHGVSTAVLTTTEQMAELEPAWGLLFTRSAEATAFQSWAWLYSWWRNYGERCALRLIAVWQGDSLIGLMPLMLDRRCRIGRLRCIGAGISDHLDILTSAEHRTLVVKALRRELEHMSGWQVLDLEQLRPEAAAWELVRTWRGPKLACWQDDLPVIEVRPPDDVVAGLSKNHRSTLRRTLRCAERERVTCALADPLAAESAGERLVALHREMWDGRPISVEHLTTRFEKHVAMACRLLAANGLGGVSEFRQGSEVVVSSLLMFGGGYVSTYLQGASRGATAKYQINALYIWDALGRANERRLSGVNLLRGIEPYKLRWKPRIVSNQRAVLGRHRLVWAPFAAHQLLRASVRRRVESGEAPLWIASLVGAYRRHRRTTMLRTTGAIAPHAQELS